MVHQWAIVHQGLRRTGCDRAINGDSRKIWLNESGKPVIEINLIKGMAHGVPCR
jgi:hypothetical protein